VSVDPSSITPIRNPSLIQRVWRAVVSREPDMGPQPQQQQTTETGRVVVTTSGHAAWNRSLNERLSVYGDADEMDGSSAEFSRALHSIANNATASEDGEQESFDVQCDDAGAKGVLDDLMARTNLHDLVQAWTRQTVKYGDSFAEIVVNNDYEVAAVKLLPTRTMGRNEDKFGNLLMTEARFDGDKVQNNPGECAFDQFDPDGQKLVATFDPWQIVHSRFLWDGVSKYGTSLANVARKDWRKLHALEEGMVIGRLTRAYLKLVIYADGTGLSATQKEEMLRTLRDQISQTQQYVDQKRGSAPSVLDNIYLTKDLVRGSDGSVHESQTKIDTLDPKNEALGNITDVAFFHRKYLANLWVPPAFYGFEDQVNAKATLTKEDVEYSRLLRGVQKLDTVAVRQVCDVELILKGYDPASVDYDIIWPTISVEDEMAAATANFQQAQADDIYMGFGVIDKAWMQQHRFGMDEEEMGEIEEPAPEPAPLIVPPIPQPPIPKPSVAAERGEFQALAVSQQRINDRLDALATNGHNGNGHDKALVGELIQAEVAAVKAGTGEVHLHIPKDMVHVHNSTTVQPAKVPDVTVNVPEQQAPAVHVHAAKQEAPTVNVQVPEAPAPKITVQPSEVNVTVEQPSTEVTVERNKDGSIRALKRK